MRARHNPYFIASQMSPKPRHEETRSEKALRRLSEMGPILGPEHWTPDEDYEARRSAVHDPMTARINASNPRKW